MNRYYLFIIKKDYMRLYRSKSYVLYKVLENLYNTCDFSYGVNIYKQLCNKISVKLLNDYIESRIRHKKINNIIKLESAKEKTYIEIKYSCIVVYTNTKKTTIFKIFNIYNRNIFVCDFKNKDYFWLNNYLKR